MKQFCDSIKIMGHDYTLLADPNLSRDRAANGECNSNELTITIDPTIKSSRIDEVYIHEVLEALQYHGQLELEHNKLSLIAELFVMFLKDNHPEIFPLVDGDE